MATYYTATNGNNSNPGTIGSPFLTINKGVSVLTPGDTLLIRTGTYVEALINTIPAGTSWSSAVTVAGYPSETVTIRPASSGASFVVLIEGIAKKYIILNNLILDAVNIPYTCLKISSTVEGQTAHHIRVQNCEIKNAAYGNGVLINGGGDYNEFLDCSIHHNGTVETDTVNHLFGYAMYVSSSYNLIDGCEFYAHGGSGIQFYSGHTILPSNNTIRNCFIHDNCVSFGTIYGRGAGIVQWQGPGHKIYNNIVVRNWYGIVCNYTNGTQVFNNTVVSNPADGINIQNSSGIEVKNNISYLNGGYIYDSTGATKTNNFTQGVDPVFVTPGSDFHLQASSKCIDAGTNVSGTLTTDYDGVARPQGTAFDIGAYEYVGGGTPDTTPPAGSITSPTNAATVSGSVTITATATDNIGVANVQFYLDGQPLGGPIT